MGIKSIGMPVLYIVQGFLGAGKTTYSKALSQKTKAVRLNADEWCAENFSDEKQVSDWDACFAKAVETLWTEAERRLKNKESVILDFGFWSKASRDHAREKAKEWGVQCEHHYVFAPDNILLERIGKRSGGIAERNIKNFVEIKQLFEEPAQDEQAVLIRNYDEHRTNTPLMRKASRADAESIASISRRARMVAMSYLPNLHTTDEDIEFFRDNVLETSEVWVAETEKIVGFCAFKKGWIDHLYVSPDHQKQGIGKSLLMKAMEYNDRLLLWTFQKNLAARNFYERNGFRLLKTTDGQNNEEKEPDALYEWAK